MDEINAVLIIDDDEDDLFLIQDKLESFVHPHCEFVTCHLKHEAINHLKNRTFDLCILDHRLSGYDGIEILSAVEDDELATPIVMLTGQNDDMVARQAIKKGAQDYVMKSAIDEDIFEKSIRYAISRKELAFAKSMSHQIQAENTAKDKFIAHLSHELRTPLTSIIGYTTLLLENQNATSLFKELNIIQNNGKHLLSLLNDVLDLSKIAARKFELRVKESDLQQVMIEISSLVSVAAIDKGLTLEFVSLTPLPLKVYIDDMRFKQVLVNLIGNAIKFTDQGGVKVTISLRQDKQKNLLEVSIQDTGIGMRESQIKEIFAPFKQIEDVTNRKAGGAGLGLAITAEIVKQMNGKLDVTSVLDEGSTFTLTLPISFNEQAFCDYQFDYSEGRPISAEVPQFIGSVLIVDDVFEIRQLVGHFVMQAGVDIEYASHGRQAIDKIKSKHEQNESFDLILMDLHMPVLNGIETVKTIKEDFSFANQTSIVAMTAATQKGLDEDLLTIGFDSLISKPIDKHELWDLLSTHLHQSVSNVSLNDQSNKALAKHQQDISDIHIHLIEDDNDSAEVMSLLLESLGCQVRHSSTAKQAIQIAGSSSQFDFHLIDLGLPDMSGEGLLKELNSSRQSGKLVILSGSQPSNEILVKNDIYKYMLKPVDKSDLVDLISLCGAKSN